MTTIKEGGDAWGLPNGSRFVDGLAGPREGHKSQEPTAFQLPLPFALVPPEELFTRVFSRLHPRAQVPTFQVTFREWAQLRSRIGFGQNRIEVEISDVLAGVAPIVLEALAEILVCRLFRTRPSREARACYLAGVLSPAVRERVEHAQRTRGFKMMLPARGRHFDLDEIFAHLNRRFFEDRLPATRLGWSFERAHTLLGHHDPAHGTITVSRAFDVPEVPRFLVEYLVFHEMLHIRFPVERNHHRRVIHSREFREAEKMFPQFDRARRALRSGRWRKTGSRKTRPPRRSTRIERAKSPVL